jgi:hypothetical protein
VWLVDSSGTLLFVADFNNHLIRQIVIATQTVTTLAGSGTCGLGQWRRRRGSIQHSALAWPSTRAAICLSAKLQSS